MEKIEQKLHVYNSYLEIKNEEIIDLSLEYGTIYYDVIHYKDGKKDKVEVQECIVFEITGKTKDKRDAYLEFELHLGLDELNKFSKKPTNIGKYIFFDGPCCQVGDNDALFLNIRPATDKIDDMYRIIDEAYIYKKSKNVFIIKMSISEDNVFTYFEVDFNEGKNKKC